MQAVVDGRPLIGTGAGIWSLPSRMCFPHPRPRDL